MTFQRRWALRALGDPAPPTPTQASTEEEAFAEARDLAHRAGSPVDVRYSAVLDGAFVPYAVIHPDEGRVTRDLTPLAARLEAAFGADPSLVGAVDGTEDDFGDLVTEAYDALAGDAATDELWDRFQDAAGASSATTMAAWLEELAAAVDEP